MGEHLNERGEFQSDKYAWCRADFVPLKLTDRSAWPMLWAYAEVRRAVDAGFADDLQARLRALGYVPPGLTLTDADMRRTYDEAADATGHRQGDTVEGDEARHDAGLRAVAEAAGNATAATFDGLVDKAEAEATAAKGELAAGKAAHARTQEWLDRFQGEVGSAAVVLWRYERALRLVDAADCWASPDVRDAVKKALAAGPPSDDEKTEHAARGGRADRYEGALVEALSALGPLDDMGDVAPMDGVNLRQMRDEIVSALGPAIVARVAEENDWNGPEGETHG